MEPQTKAIQVFMIAGEASADLHGGGLLRELRARLPAIECYGVGGESLAREGMEVAVDARALNVVGISDWFDKAGEVIGSYRKLRRLIAERRPDCAILLDLPDLNLRMAKHLNKLGVPVVYYISPQVWAWRRYRIAKIKKLVDRMLVVFPFEKTFYENCGMDARFVGHPLLESLQAREKYRAPSVVHAAPRIALLPGSRRSELKFHAPILRQVAEKLRERYPAIEFKLPVASTLSLENVREAMASDSIQFVEGSSRDVLEWADVALIASGTATLEAALVGTPFALFYRVSASSAWIYRNLARYRGYIGMPNLLHGREVVREFFQEKANAVFITEEAIRLIEDDAYRTVLADNLRDCRRRLGQPGASARAAVEVIEILRQAPDRGRATVGIAPAL